MKKRYAFAAVLLVGLLAPSMANATSDEAACGEYSYKSAGLQLRFILNLDGARDLRINGRLFKGPIPLDESGWPEKTYTFSVLDRGRTKSISLIVLFRYRRWSESIHWLLL